MGRLKVLHGDVGECCRSGGASGCSRLLLQYPTAVAHHLYKLGQVHGHGKISYTLMSMGLPESIQKIMEGYLRYGRAFKLEGRDF